MTVYFESVGAQRKTWSAELETLSDSALLRQIRKHGALMSRGVDFEWEGCGTAAAILVGGVRQVGTVRVEGGAKI
jgi:hypothetical protein